MKVVIFMGLYLSLCERMAGNLICYYTVSFEVIYIYRESVMTLQIPLGLYTQKLCI